MKVLIVAFWFPPSNLIGAIRVGKLASYLVRRGYELRVLTTDINEDRSLPLEIPKEQVIYTDYRERTPWLDFLVRPFRRVPAFADPANPEAAGRQNGQLRVSTWHRLRRHYDGLTNIPDLRIDWLETAVPAGRRLIEDWRPDIIFASAPPFTGLMLASRLSKTFNIPWVADFRDLWVDNPYYNEPGWRRPVDAVLERLTVRNAAALVTISPALAEQLRRRHSKAVEVVYNGYAEEDFPQPPPSGNCEEALIIRYTGSIYQGFRNPSAVFAAIGLLSDTLRDQVTVEFFGPTSDEVLGIAAEHRVCDRVVVRPAVPYRRALELQMEADVLLLLQWNDKADEGNLPGKIFEYLYARRPILFIGYEEGVAARLIKDRGAGLVSNKPREIRDQLQAWIEAKRTGRLKRLDPSVSRGLSRDDQFRKLERLFAEIVDQRRVTTVA